MHGYPSSPESESCGSPRSPTPSDLTFSDTSSVDIDFLNIVPPTYPTLPTYKLVGDNVDKNVKPRDMRSDNQTRSLHYFHTYAVRDRVDISSQSNEKQIPDIDSVQLENLLPDSQDEKVLFSNFAELVGRTLKKYLPFFEKFGSGMERHIAHEFSQEMARKSEVVNRNSLIL